MSPKRDDIVVSKSFATTYRSLSPYNPVTLEHGVICG